jgi:hypothetical protein
MRCIGDITQVARNEEISALLIPLLPLNAHLREPECASRLRLLHLKSASKAYKKPKGKDGITNEGADDEPIISRAV